MGVAAARSRLPDSLEHAADLVPVSRVRRALRLVLPPLAPSLCATTLVIAALVFSDRDVASLLLPAGSERLMLDSTSCRQMRPLRLWGRSPSPSSRPAS